MRVATIAAYTRGVDMMQRIQSTLDRTQQQIASRRRILSPSDDPIGASQALNLRTTLGRLEQFDRNAGIATSRLAQEETALNAVNNVLQRVRELALQGNNATQNGESRRLLAIEMREQLKQLVQLANQQDGSGGQLFSGNSADTVAVTSTGSTFTYNGDQGQSFVQIGEGRRVADGDSGAAVFFAIRDGNGTFSTAAAGANTGTGLLAAGSLVNPSLWVQDQYTVRFIDESNYEVLDSSAAVVTTSAFQPGDNVTFNGIEFSLNGQPAAGDEFLVSPSRFQNVFETVDQIATALEQGTSDDASRVAFNNAVNAGLLNIDQSIANVLDIRTQVGSRLATIENQIDSNGADTLTFQEMLAGIEDLDYAEALSRLSLEVSTLEAAQKSFVRTQSLSLFNYF